MKRTGNLYDKLLDETLLRVALKNASRGKKKRRDVQRTLANADEKIAILKRVLSDFSYHPMPYKKKTIQDRGSGKIREIFIPRFFPDQVVQWAVVLVLRPIFMRGMIDHSCASIEGRGGNYGIKFVRRWLDGDPVGTKYCLQLDIKKFYPSISQDILLHKLKKKIKCPKMLWLLEKIIYSVPSGLPIGNVTSQWFANFYLEEFDHFVKEKLHIKYYIRYMDDMVLFSSNRRRLEKQRKEIEEFLKQDGLSLKPAFKLFEIGSLKGERPLDFLGYRFYRNFQTLRKRTFLRATRRIKKTFKKGYYNCHDSQALLSYLARLKLASGNALYKRHFKPYAVARYLRIVVSISDKAKNKRLAS